MFFATYLWRELSRRVRHTVVIALGLAMGIGLVITVSAVSAGVASAQSAVLGALYGVGTNVIVTGAAVPSPGSGGASPQGGQSVVPPTPGGGPSVQIGRSGPELCTNGKCVNAAGKTESDLTSTYLGISASKVAEAARLRGVAAAAGGIMLLDETVTFAKSGDGSQPGGYTVYGVDTQRPSLGPLSSASLVSGHWFTAADADADVAIVDSGYAKSHGLSVGSAVFVNNQVRYTVTGIVSQPQGSNPPDVYIPLQRAQAMPLLDGNLRNDVNTIYLTASSATGIRSVSQEISRLLPGTTVTTASSLASQVTGSLVSAIKLADGLGTLVSALALAAAFAAASLLTLAAVDRRAREFGTLKALGWQSRRILGQVLGESAAIGVAGAAAGIGIGFAAMAIIASVAPTLYATSEPAMAKPILTPHGENLLVGGGALVHLVPVALHPTVSAGVLWLAVGLALAGGLLAGVFAAWRIARLRPVTALSQVA
jgi:putative ABC transport system permease protein